MAKVSVEIPRHVTVDGKYYEGGVRLMPEAEAEKLAKLEVAEILRPNARAERKAAERVIDTKGDDAKDAKDDAKPAAKKGA